MQLSLSLSDLFLLLCLLTWAGHVARKWILDADKTKVIKNKLKYGISASSSFEQNKAEYQTYQGVQKALREAGLESCNLMIGVDFTKSNLWAGERTFSGKCLHSLDKQKKNPYQRVIEACGRTLESFDDDHLIPAYGFGDTKSQDKSVFTLNLKRNPQCGGFTGVLDAYASAATQVELSGPTSFVPLIEKAIAECEKDGKYHILIIVADGQVTDKRANADVIVKASKYPLSIVMVGVGDGPWDEMERYDDQLPARKFDNFQFVNFDLIMRQFDGNDSSFAMYTLQEIPQQYQAICKLGYLG